MAMNPAEKKLQEQISRMKSNFNYEIIDDRKKGYGFGFAFESKAEAEKFGKKILGFGITAGDGKSAKTYIARTDGKGFSISVQEHFIELLDRKLEEERVLKEQERKRLEKEHKLQVEELAKLLSKSVSDSKLKSLMENKDFKELIESSSDLKGRSPLFEKWDAFLKELNKDLPKAEQDRVNAYLYGSYFHQQIREIAPFIKQGINERLKQFKAGIPAKQATVQITPTVPAKTATPKVEVPKVAAANVSPPAKSIAPVVEVPKSKIEGQEFLKNINKFVSQVEPGFEIVGGVANCYNFRIPDGKDMKEIIAALTAKGIPPQEINYEQRRIGVNKSQFVEFLKMNQKQDVIAPTVVSSVQQAEIKMTEEEEFLKNINKILKQIDPKIEIKKVLKQFKGCDTIQIPENINMEKLVEALKAKGMTLYDYNYMNRRISIDRSKFAEFLKATDALAISKGVGGFSEYCGIDKNEIRYNELQAIIAKQMIRQLSPMKGWEKSSLTKLAENWEKQGNPIVTLGGGQEKDHKAKFEKAFGTESLTVSKSTLKTLSDSAKIVTNSKVVTKELFLKIQKELIDDIKEQETRKLKDIIIEKGGEKGLKEWMSKYKELGYKSEEELEKALNVPMLLLATNICHSQEVHFLVEQQVSDGMAYNKLRTGNLDKETPNVVISVPGINLRYGGLNVSPVNKPPLLIEGIPAEEYLRNMWEAVLESAVQQGCRDLAMPAIGLGAFAGSDEEPPNYGPMAAPIYFKTLFELLQKGGKYGDKFDNVFFNPLQYGKQFQQELKIQEKNLGCPVHHFKGDVKFLAIELAKKGQKCALINPSDADVVLGKYDVGEYYKSGNYVGEEDIAATSTAALGSRLISGVYTDPLRISSTVPSPKLTGELSATAVVTPPKEAQKPVVDAAAVSTAAAPSKIATPAPPSKMTVPVSRSEAAPQIKIEVKEPPEVKSEEIAQRFIDNIPNLSDSVLEGMRTINPRGRAEEAWREEWRKRLSEYVPPGIKLSDEKVDEILSKSEVLSAVRREQENRKLNAIADKMVSNVSDKELDSTFNTTRLEVPQRRESEKLEAWREIIRKLAKPLEKGEVESYVMDPLQVRMLARLVQDKIRVKKEQRDAAKVTPKSEQVAPTGVTLTKADSGGQTHRILQFESSDQLKQFLEAFKKTAKASKIKGAENMLEINPKLPNALVIHESTGRGDVGWYPSEGGKIGLNFGSNALQLEFCRLAGFQTTTDDKFYNKNKEKPGPGIILAPKTGYEGDEAIYFQPDKAVTTSKVVPEVKVKEETKPTVEEYKAFLEKEQQNILAKFEKGGEEAEAIAQSIREESSWTRGMSDIEMGKFFERTQKNIDKFMKESHPNTTLSADERRSFGESYRDHIIEAQKIIAVRSMTNELITRELNKKIGPQQWKEFKKALDSKQAEMSDLIENIFDVSKEKLGKDYERFEGLCDKFIKEKFKVSPLASRLATATDTSAAGQAVYQAGDKGLGAAEPTGAGALKLHQQQAAKKNVPVPEVPKVPPPPPPVPPQGAKP